MADDVLKQLENLSITHRLVSCDPAFADTHAFCEQYGYDLQDCANTILVSAKFSPSSGKENQLVACLLLASDKLDTNSKVRKALKARKVSFADAQTTKQVTGMQIGGVTPIGLPQEIPLWIDTNVLQRPEVILGGGTRDRKFLVPPNELLKLTNAASVDITKSVT